MQAASHSLAFEDGLLSLPGESTGEEKMVPEDASSTLVSWLHEVLLQK